MNQSSSALTARDLDEAKERGALAGEIRVLKWSAGLAIVALLGGMGMLYQNQIVQHERVVRVEERVMALEGRMARIEERMTQMEGRMVRIEERMTQMEGRMVRIEERMTRIEERMLRIEERLDSIEKQLATISSQMATLTSRQTRSP